MVDPSYPTILLVIATVCRNIQLYMGTTTLGSIIMKLETFSAGGLLPASVDQLRVGTSLGSSQVYRRYSFVARDLNYCVEMVTANRNNKACIFLSLNQLIALFIQGWFFCAPARLVYPWYIMPS